MFDESVGLLQRGCIVGFDLSQNIMKVSIPNAVSQKGSTWQTPFDVPYSPGLFYNNGLFIGTVPQVGTAVVVGQGSGGQYYFVSFLPDGFSGLPELSEDYLGKILIRGNDNNRILVDDKSNTYIGSDANQIHIHTGSKDQPNTNLISINFKNENHFTQAYREIGGLIKRDKELNTSFSQNNKLENDDYDPYYKVIGLDSSIPANNLTFGSIKNPPLVEHREMVYEFQYESNVTNDLKESLQYGKSKSTNTSYNLPNRRKSRADTLSLTLLEPNYLLETVKGTVVDIFGNILDLNREPLPIGKDKNTLHIEKGADGREAYLKIRELERKSLAFHFEINARKDLSSKNAKASTIDLLDINSNKNNSTIRSRFFIDVDKEGQFKINVPASSEKGNIPLLTRYENYSSYSAEDNSNPNQFFVREDKRDIFQDSFAAAQPVLGDGVGFSKERGSIKLQDDNKKEAAPKDRITESHIKHGTAHHDILQTCSAFNNKEFINYQYGTNAVPTVDIDSIPLLKDIVSDTIIVDGDGAFDKGGPNAGGRSGSINLDGMFEFNVGANTIDRQSMWADFAGGSIINLGRDRKSRSAVVQADGDIYMQIGNFGISTDSRFANDANGKVGAVLDLRIMTSGNCTHMIRCDDNGITIMTPGALSIHSSGNMRIQSDANIDIDCEALTIMERGVQKLLGSI